MSAGDRADAVRALVGATRFASIDWVRETGSTNDDLVASAESDLAERVLIADLQTAGRGRRGRSWDAPIDSGVLLSLLVREARGCSPFWTIGSVALGAAEAAASLIDADVGLKWPNDLLVDGRKISGVLAVGAHGAVVVGIGTNVNWHDGRPTGVPETATALSEHAGGSIDRVQFAARLIERSSHWLDAPLDEVRRGWNGRCVTLGTRVRVELDDDEALVGVAVEIAADGGLVVATDAGSRHVVHVGDVVHLRPAAEPLRPDE